MTNLYWLVRIKKKLVAGVDRPPPDKDITFKNIDHTFYDTIGGKWTFFSYFQSIVTVFLLIKKT